MRIEKERPTLASALLCVEHVVLILQYGEGLLYLIECNVVEIEKHLELLHVVGSHTSF